MTLFPSCTSVVGGERELEHQPFVERHCHLHLSHIPFDIGPSVPCSCMPPSPRLCRQSSMYGGTYDGEYRPPSNSKSCRQISGCDSAIPSLLSQSRARAGAGAVVAMACSLLGGEEKSTHRSRLAPHNHTTTLRSQIVMLSMKLLPFCSTETRKIEHDCATHQNIN